VQIFQKSTPISFFFYTFAANLKQHPMKRLFMLFVMAMAPLAMSAQDNSQQVQPEKATTKACCSKDKKDGAACHKEGAEKVACHKDEKPSCDKNNKNCCKDSKNCCKDSKDEKSCCKDGKACCKDSKDGKSCCKDGKGKDGKSCGKDQNGVASDKKEDCKKDGKKSCCAAKKAA